MSMYPFLYNLVHIALRVYHPIFKVTGRENVPENTQLILCGNHSGMTDPIWMLFALKLNKSCPAIMAKASVMKVPLLGRLLRHYGVFAVHRGESDLSSVKMGLSALKQGKHLLLFPEATRVKKGKVVEPKNGAVLFSLRSGVPILPVYVETKRYPFSPMRCVIGQPWTPPASSKKAGPEEMSALTKTLLENIYKLGETQ